MITDSYNGEKESLITPEAFYKKGKIICDTAIATFSNEIFKAVIDKYPHREVGRVVSANGFNSVYLVDLNHKSVIFYLSPIGACMSGNQIIEIQWITGIRKLIMFGSCGTLDSKATEGKYIIPTQAYRDEGMSYHYAPPSDYIDVKNSEMLAGIFGQLKLPYVKGRIWTTDAPYRETKTAVEKRKTDGCIAVEMELAGMQAVCDFHGIELYHFLMTGDVLDGSNYDLAGLVEANHFLNNFNIAVKISELI